MNEQGRILQVVGDLKKGKFKPMYFMLPKSKNDPFKKQLNLFI